MKKLKKSLKEYALYKGDNCLAIGTIKEIAEIMNVKYKTIAFYTTSTYKKRCNGSEKRLTMVELD